MSPRSRRSPKAAAPRKVSSRLSVAFLVAAMVLFAAVRLGWLPSADPEMPSPTPVAVGASATSTEDAGSSGTATPDTAATEPPTPVVAVATATEEPVGAATLAPTEAPTPTANAPPTPTRASNLPTIAVDDLPREALDTIRLIEQGGPYPFDRDGITFQNRERLLPLHPQGYYREYTVITPGERTRGARRIVAGNGGEMYYTDDHYDSFREIVR